MSGGIISNWKEHKGGAHEYAQSDDDGGDDTFHRVTEERMQRVIHYSPRQQPSQASFKRGSSLASLQNTCTL